MIKKLKTYKTFEGLGTPFHKEEDPRDINYEDKIDEVLKDLIKRKQNISLLKDTIDFICKDLEKALPDMEQFMAALQHYDKEIYDSVSEIKENMIDGMPNIKDIIGEVSNNFDYIEDFLKNKK